MDIAFNINPLGLEGLGATLSSLIRNCSAPHQLKLWFLCNECQPYHKSCINILLDEEGFNGTVSFIDFHAQKLFGHLRPLHGDWTGYGRLLIPEYITSEVVLYLDADLLVLTDVLTLKDFSFNDRFLAAVAGGKVKYALERDFLMQKMQLSPELDYFNSGVILLHTAQWRAQGLQEQWRDISSRYPDDLLAIDQTVLNAVCRGDFAHLPAHFNTAWCPGDAMPANAEDSILHFVGSPKPWDVFGKKLHSGYPHWRAYNTVGWARQFNRIKWNKLVRTWKIRNSILLKMKRKYLQKK